MWNRGGGGQQGGREAFRMRMEEHHRVINRSYSQEFVSA